MRHLNLLSTFHSLPHGNKPSQREVEKFYTLIGAILNVIIILAYQRYMVAWAERLDQRITTRTQSLPSDIQVLETPYDQISVTNHMQSLHETGGYEDLPKLLDPICNFNYHARNPQESHLEMVKRTLRYLG